ncbi:MAG: ABC transporter permease subunit [Pseudomonadota bacterium]
MLKFENVDPKPGEGMRASGSGFLGTIRYATLPQVLPIMASQALYFLESNFRNAAVLGIVGAGGIGFELEERIRIFAFDQVIFIIILYMNCATTLDTVSGKIRARLV